MKRKQRTNPKALTTLSSLTSARSNPREIAVQNLSHLKHSIDSFGDISGIVFNERTAELVCGHQRVLALREQYGDLTIENGRITLPNGDSFTVRVVQWTEAEQHAAMVAANSLTTQGTFTHGLGSLLADLQTQIPNVYESLGFSSLKPREIAGPESWSDSYNSESAPWDESPKAREGKALSESIADEVKLEARFDLRVPEKLAKKASKLLLDLVKKLPGATLKRLD